MERPEKAVAGMYRRGLRARIWDLLPAPIAKFIAVEILYNYMEFRSSIAARTTPVPAAIRRISAATRT